EPTNADRIGGIDDPPCCVLEQRAPDAPPMVRRRNREPPENYYRDRVGHVASKSPRAGGDGDGTRRECVICNNDVVLTRDERARGAARLVGECPLLEPVVQDLLAAREALDDMA